MEKKVGATPEPSGETKSGVLDGGILHRFDRDGLHEAMHSAMPDIERCYEEWLKIRPSLGGQMRVRFRIDTDDGIEGEVSRVSVGDAGTGNIAFEGCVLSVVSALRFEPPMDGHVDVSYPLVFVPPVQRRETFTRAISSAIGAPWNCPEFDALWEGKPIGG